MSSHTWMPTHVPWWGDQDVIRFYVRCEACGEWRIWDAYVEERTLAGKCDPDERTVRGVAGSQ